MVASLLGFVLLNLQPTINLTMYNRNFTTNR